MATGNWEISTRDKPRLKLTTAGMPMKLSVTAPITAGSLAVAADADFRVVLSLSHMEAGNLLAKGVVGTARKLVVDNGGDDLVFEAQAAGVSGPWSLAGTAYAGTLEIPTTVIATPASEMRALHIGGTITLDDIEIPLPGFGGVSSITFDLEGKVVLVRV